MPDQQPHTPTTQDVQWIETCRCGASIKLTGWMYSNTEKAALEWRKDHRCKNPYIKETRNV